MYAELLKHRLVHRGKSTRKILFVIGTGRSGTHFLTRCLIGNNRIDDLTGGEENPLVFRRLTLAALGQLPTTETLRIVERIYNSLSDSVSPSWFIDQSHPNIWFAEHWASVYQTANFVGIIRNPFSVVSSMMKHGGVMNWISRSKHLRIPNAFLGITFENSEAYDTMSIAERCTLRWISHYKRLSDLRTTIGTRLSVVHFESFCREPHVKLAEIAGKLHIGSNFGAIDVDDAAITRGDGMSHQDITAIDRLLEQSNVESQWRTPPW